MTEPTPPDRPPVSRPRRSRFVLVFGVLAAGVLGLWLVAGMSGWALGSTGEHDTIPASVRSSPGGYRAFHFWHSGYQGGK